MTTTITSSVPFLSKTYAWTGSPNVSTSVELVEGRVFSTNYVTNPSFETNADNISVGSAFSRSWTAERSRFGSRSVKLTRKTATPGNGYGSVTIAGLTAGRDYVFSVYVAGGTPGDTYDAKGASGIQSGGARVAWTAGVEEWHRVVIPFVPSGTTATFYAVTDDPSSAVNGSAVYLDGMMVTEGYWEAQYYDEDYFDGYSAPYTQYFESNPLVVDGWSESVESRNIINPVMAGGVDVTLRQAGLRTGTFVLVFEYERSAQGAMNMFSEPATFTLSDDERPTVGLTFVVNGTLERTLDDESREFWLVTVPFQEV